MFKENLFAALDAAEQTTEQKLTRGHQESSPFSSRYHVYNMQIVTSKEIMGHCLNCQKCYSMFMRKDIEAADLCNELQFITKAVEKRALLQEILKFVCKRKASSQYYKCHVYCSTYLVDTSLFLWPVRVTFLGAFAKLRKATSSFAISVCLSVLLPRLRLSLDEFS